MKVVSLFPELSSQSVDCSRCHELCGSDLNWFEPYPLTEVKDFRDWKYSSYEVILSPNGKPTVIKREEVMRWFGTSDNPEGIAPKPMDDRRPGKMPQV